MKLCTYCGIDINIEKDITDTTKPISINRLPKTVTFFNVPFHYPCIKPFIEKLVQLTKE